MHFRITLLTGVVNETAWSGPNFFGFMARPDSRPERGLRRLRMK